MKTKSNAHRNSLQDQRFQGYKTVVSNDCKVTHVYSAKFWWITVGKYLKRKSHIYKYKAGLLSTPFDQLFTNLENIRNYDTRNKTNMYLLMVQEYETHCLMKQERHFE